MFRKSIIKHLLKKVWDMIRTISGKNKSPSYTHLNIVGPGESLPPCRGLWGTLHTGDDIDCNTCLLWEC